MLSRRARSSSAEAIRHRTTRAVAFLCAGARKTRFTIWRLSAASDRLVAAGARTGARADGGLRAPCVWGQSKAAGGGLWRSGMTHWTVFNELGELRPIVLERRANKSRACGSTRGAGSLLEGVGEFASAGLAGGVAKASSAVECAEAEPPVPCAMSASGRSIGQKHRSRSPRKRKQAQVAT
jgi:hypothetical protein